MKVRVKPTPAICPRDPHGVPRYFPTGIFAKDQKMDLEWGCMYSEALTAVRESPLWPTNPEVHAYRFLWLRSFDPITAIRVEEDDKQNHTLVAKQVAAENKSKPTEDYVLTTYSRKLSDKDWREFERLLREANFWSLPSEAYPVRNPDGTIEVRFDGAQWIMEAAVRGNYHVADFWSPEPNGPDASYRRLCLFVLSLSGIKVPENRIY